MHRSSDQQSYPQQRRGRGSSRQHPGWCERNGGRIWGAGQPVELLEALHSSGAKDLTIIANNAGTGDQGVAALIADGRVRKIVCSFPRQKTSWHFDSKYRTGEIELELTPQGTLAERIRAGGAGIGAFYVRTGYGTMLSKGKHTQHFDGEGHVLETALKAEFALIRGHASDRWGNLV